MTRSYLVGLTALAAVALSGSHPAPSPSARVMVRDAPDLDRHMAAVGSHVVRHAHSGAFVGVSVPSGHNAQSFATHLRALGHRDASPIAIMTGAGQPTSKKGGPSNPPDAASPHQTTLGTTSARADATPVDEPQPLSFASYQWHLDDLDLRTHPHRADGVVVAVIDSGVAYTDAVEDGQTFRAASSLASVPIVAPWDFVEDDALPLDEHQHGTHIASLIASEGLVRGVAPGVHLMPLRVLDHTNSGSELDLVDAIHWAIDNGAQVVNLSLSFPTGYLPSVALEEALQRADQEGVVVVAATGNDGANIISWPAASPTTIAVSGSATYWWGTTVAPYANIDPRVSVMAPGGDVLADANGDGYPDGLLGETIALRDPSQPGLWFMEGTSQAAALASGTAALLLARGYAPHDVLGQLQYTSRPDFGTPPQSASKGLGAGSLDPHQAVMSGDVSRLDSWMADYTVSVLPYLERRHNGSVVPHARLTLLADGEVATTGTIHGSFWGSTESYFQCPVSSLSDGGYHCDVSAPPVAQWHHDAAWLVSADLVTTGAGLQRPTAAAFGSHELDVLVAAMHNDAEIDGGVLGFMWHETDTEEFGPVAEGYTISDLGSGLLSSPMGLLARPGAITAPTTYSLDLDGSGLLSSPMGFQTVRILSFSTFSGSGLLSSPMGFFSLPKLVFVDGTGLLSSPMGFSASTLLTADTTSTKTSWSMYSGSSVDDGSQPLGEDSWAHGPSLLISTDAAHVDDANSGAAHLPGVPFIP